MMKKIILPVSIFVLGTLSSCTDPKESTNEATVTTAKTNENSNGIITFENITHDFGPIWDIDEQTYSFKFKNTGNDTLEILNVKASCGCTTPKLEKKIYSIGETGELTLSFKPKGFGTQQKTLTVTSNCKKAPTQKLTIKATISPFVKTLPSRLNFNAIASNSGGISKVNFSPADNNLKVLSIKPTGQNARFLRTTLVPKDAGPSIATNTSNNFDVEVELLPGARWGDFYGSFEINVSGNLPGNNKPVNHTYSIPVNAKVFNTVKADNTMFQIGPAKPNKTVSKKVTLKRFDGLPFTISSAVATGTTIKNAIIKSNIPFGEAAVKHILTLSGKSGSELNKAMGGFVIIQTDVQDDERLQFRIAGIVR